MPVMSENESSAFATVPMKTVGPIRITGPVIDDEAIMVPLATYESPLWPSVARGAKVSVSCGGIRTVIVDERMTRSVAVQAENAEQALLHRNAILAHKAELAVVAASTSRFAQLLDINTQIVGNLLYIRFELSTGDASGHNMATKAAEAMLDWVLQNRQGLGYVSISGNFCTDKKAYAVNGILGRRKNAVADIVIPRDTCDKILRTTPEKLVDLHIKKNLIGTMVAGGLRSANAHYANMLLAFYLATGQDAANIVEGSQGFVHAEVRDDALYFSVTVPNLIVGTVGNGKDLPFVQSNMELLGCTKAREPGANARRLAAIAAATVLCGELSLLAAQTNPGELMRAHIKLERKAGARKKA